MSNYRFQVTCHNGIDSLYVVVDAQDRDTHIPLADIESAIAQYRRTHRLVARKRTAHGQELYWIGRGKGRNFVFYADVHAPTGYGFRSKAKAEQIASEIEERLRKEREEKKRP